MAKINVKEAEITIVTVNNEDYISLTDMLKAKDGDFFITDWLRNRNTLEYIGIWEQLYNPTFNYGEFAIIKSQAGLNNFKISVKELVQELMLCVFKLKQDVMVALMPIKILRLNLGCG